MIELQQISKSFLGPQGPIHAIQNISLTVPKGQICGVIGRSGAGKSTLVRCVNLLERPTAGRVLVNGLDLLSLSTKALRQARHDIGMVFQHFNLLSSRTVFQNVAFQLELLGHTAEAIESAVMSMLTLVGLEDKRDQYPQALSGGQKQRVAIARALVTQPKILLCDEMTSALDPETTQSILDLIKKVNQALGVTILFITHEMEVVKRLADQVVVIDRGQAVEQCNVVDLFRSPQSAVAQQFVQGDLQGHIPPELREQLQMQDMPGAQQLIHISFIGETATQPVIDAFIKHSNLHVNILQADLEYLKQATIGTMTIGLLGDVSARHQAIAYLKEQGLAVQELGYVK
jgi:D-methionine transport system ATP-binding protein